jgi:uncharacterized RmlC-like cupin family protein
MTADAPLRHIAADTLERADPTPGMDRRRAIDSGSMWAGAVTTEPGAVSGWHHHGEHESTIYIAEGALRMEFGAGGVESFDALAGDFIHVPPGAVHRESNPRDHASLIIVVRAGQGAPTINVDGPA